MRLSSAVLGVIGATLGATLGVIGYQTTAASSAPKPGPTVVAPVGRPLPAPPARVTVKVAPCARGAHLVHGVCVTTVERTVVVHDAPPPAPAAAAAPAAPPQSAQPVGQTGPAAPAQTGGQTAGGYHDDGGSEPPEPGDD